MYYNLILIQQSQVSLSSEYSFLRGFSVANRPAVPRGMVHMSQILKYPQLAFNFSKALMFRNRSYCENEANMLGHQTSSLGPQRDTGHLLRERKFDIDSSDCSEAWKMNF